MAVPWRALVKLSTSSKEIPVCLALAAAASNLLKNSSVSGAVASPFFMASIASTSVDSPEDEMLSTVLRILSKATP